MPIDPAAAAVLKVLDRAEEGIWQALEAGCRAYATGLRAKPIVDRHFTPGNQQRYGWPPLSREYFLAKQRGIVSHRGASHHLAPHEHAKIAGLKGPKRKAALDKLLDGRQGSKLDANAGFRSSTGTMVGFGSGKNLPMLVLTGKLRQAVTGKNATIQINRANGVATITFHGLPEYALYLHEGTARMPARSPVEPSEDDLAMVREAVLQFYNDLIGKARANPIRGGAATVRR